MKLKKIFILLFTLCPLFVWSADGDIFEYTTNDGYTFRFLVLSEEEKTVQIGADPEGESAAIVKTPSNHYMATVTIPESVWHGSNYTVTAIGKGAFSQLYWLKKVVIPETVAEIGEYAFEWCTYLSEVNLPKGLKTIREFTFFYTALESITIPEGVDSIKRSAFNGAMLKSLYIPSTVKYIHSVGGEQAFRTATRLSSIKVAEDNTVYDSRNDCNAIIEKSTMRLVRGCCNTVIPDNIKVIGGNAMDYAYYSQERNSSFFDPTTPGAFSIVLPQTVIELESNCFDWCNEIRKITLPKNLKAIGEWSFHQCSALDTIVSYIREPFEISSHNFLYTGWNNNQQQVLTKSPVLYVPKGTADKYRQVAGWNLAREIIEIPATIITFTDPEVKRLCVANWDTNGDEELDEDEAAAVTTLGTVFANKAIASFDELEYFTGLTSLEDYAFYCCSSLNSITIPCNVISIGESAFNGCGYLSSISIGSRVTNIGRQAFWNCNSLSSVNISGIEAWCNIAFEDIYANPVSLAHHLLLNGTEIKDLVIPEGVISIKNYAFCECNGFTSVTVDNGVKSIGEKAFSYCSGLKSVTIGNDVETIADGAFSGCNSMSDITIGCGLSAIGCQAFESCTNLSAVNISSIEAWCNIDFEELSNPLQYAHHLYLNGEEITDLVIPNSVTSISNHAFRECNLTSVVIGDHVKTIGQWAFAHCHNLVNLTIHEGLTTIGDYAFFYCEELTTLTIPNSVTIIGESAFGCCKELTTLSLGNGITSTGVSAFTECTGLTTVIIPKNVTTIDYGTFRNCSELKSISIPYGVTTINDYAFSGCTNLSSISIPASVTTIGDDGVFWGCSSLTSIILPNSLTSIGNRTFYECTGLTSITIPMSLSDIGDLFYGCTNLISVTVESETPISIDAYTFPNRANATLYVPFGCRAVYEAAEYWKEFKDIIEMEDPNADTDLSRIDNTLYINKVEAFTGKEATLSVQMKNTVAVEGFTFDLYLPDGVTVVTDTDGFPEVMLSEVRTNSQHTNTFDVTLLGDGGLRIFAASTNGSAFSGNDGEVSTIKVLIANNLEEGDYAVVLRNIIISDADATGHKVERVKSTLTVSTHEPGDANGDGKLTVADYTAIAHYVMGRTTGNFEGKAADANRDGEVNVADYTAVAHLILYGSIDLETNETREGTVNSLGKLDNPLTLTDRSPNVDGENTMYIEPLTLKAGEEVTLSVRMRNSVEIEGFGFDLYLPEGFCFVTDADGFPVASLSNERTTLRRTNTFESVILHNGALRIFAASTNGSTISGNDGEVAQVTIKSQDRLRDGDYTIELRDIALSDTEARSLDTDLIVSTITIAGNTTGISTVCTAESNDVYTIAGNKVRSNVTTLKGMPGGVYVVNGKKVVVK